ncbi:MAG: hypothetical protein HYT46_00705, partial [Candidatus Vogelbacteria bacterium]|nr:hypothetical protein [Candidatus Vogelbacteria bacterium]
MGGQPTSFWKFVAVVGAVAVFWFTFLNQWSRVPNQLAAPAALTATSFFDDYDNLSYVDQSSLNNVVWDGASALIFTASAGSTGEIDPNGSFGSGLVALWHMNGNAQDSSGRGNHGSIVGNVNCAASGSGKFNQGCSFDGASYIDLGKKISNFSQPFTIAGWVNPSSTSGVREVLSGGQLAQFFQLGGELRYRTNYSDSRTNALINTGQWTHVAVSYDGSAIKLYVNGVLQLTDSRGALDGEQTTWIGAYHDAGTAAAYWWLGMLDEIAVWNRALTAADITALAQATGGGSTSGSFQSAPITTGSFSQLAANWSETAAGASAVSWSGNNGASWCPINKGQTLTSSPCLPGTGLKYKVEFSGADTLQNVNFNWVPVTAGPVCGNGVIEGTEQCDGANLNNQTCASRGFTGGT